jgi:hypothetical protein
MTGGVLPRLTTGEAVGVVISTADAEIGMDRTAAMAATKNLPMENSSTVVGDKVVLSHAAKAFNLSTSSSVNYFT